MAAALDVLVNLPAAVVWPGLTAAAVVPLMHPLLGGKPNKKGCMIISNMTGFSIYNSRHTVMQKLPIVCRAVDECAPRGSCVAVHLCGGLLLLVHTWLGLQVTVVCSFKH